MRLSLLLVLATVASASCYPIKHVDGAGDAAAGDGGASGGTGGAGAGGMVGGDGGQDGTGGAPTAGSGGATAGSGGAGPADGGSDALPGGSGGSGGPDALCRLFQVRPESEVPTVFVLVDRSGSMFYCAGSSTMLPCADQSNTPWVVLKAAVMDMVERLQGVVRFGFGAFTGEQTGTGTGVCPMFDKVDAALNNRAAIATLYDGLGAPVKGETPTAQVLGMVRDLLAADPAAGPKYILLVTDGQPDYCNDGNPLCPIDGVVHQLQRLSGGGINTLVFGVQSALAGIPASTLQAFANAGAGQPVMQLTTLANDVYFQCQAMTVWLQQHQMLGRAPMEPLGIYASGGGTATVYSPDPTNPQAVADLFAATVAGVKSCTFDLVDGLRVDLAQIDRASVIVGGVEVARDAANGWSMASETRLVLAGSACTRWRMPDVRSIDFRFPCGVVHTN